LVCLYSTICAKVNGTVTEILKCHSFKPGQYKEWRKFLLLSEIRETVQKLYFLKKFYVWQVIPAFFQSITLTTQEKEFLSSLGKIVNIYLEENVLFSRRYI